MAYHQHIRDVVEDGPVALGPHLGRWAVRKNFSVIRVAAVTGASRATVYTWYRGGEVSNAYKTSVHKLVGILKDSKDAATAWSKACRAFPHLRT